jgi:hypothetical protein
VCLRVQLYRSRHSPSPPTHLSSLQAQVFNIIHSKSEGSWLPSYACYILCVVPFLGVFSKLRKATISFVMSVRPSVRMKQLGSHWTDFNEIWNLKIFRKSVQKIQVSLKSDKTEGYFTWRPIYICDHISLISSQNEKSFIQICRENQNEHFVFSDFFSKILPFMR